MSRPSEATRVALRSPSIRIPFIGQAVLAGAPAAIYLLVLLTAASHQQDTDAYLAGGHSLLDGRPLYATFLQHPFPDPTLRPAYIYPPCFALLLAPLALLPRSLALVLWLVINQVALLGAAFLLIRRLQPGAWATAAMVAATASFYPLWIDAVQGQANLLIVLLVCVGLLGIRDGDDRFATGFGLATALKLTPAPLLLCLLLARRWWAAAWMTAGFLAATAAGAIVRPADSVTFFTRVLPALAHGTAVYANQSLTGFLLRIGTPNPYTDHWLEIPATVLMILLATGLLSAWFWRTRRQQPLQQALAFLPLLPLLSALTWPHHLVIVLPLLWAILAALGARGWPRLETLATVAMLGFFSVVPRLPIGPAFGQPGFRAAQTADPIVVFAANSFLLATLLLFFLCPWLLRSR